MSKDSFQKAKDFIIKAGFSHIKIELEADLGREDCEYDCYECRGSGSITCHECNGAGVIEIEDDNGNMTEVECDECGGIGEVNCDECDGSGRQDNQEWDCDTCKEYILDKVPAKAREALTYSEFYYDGSVDSELTLTLPVKDADYLEDYIEAFKDLGDEIGNGVETGGAGMHICVIPAEAGGKYPVPRDTLNLSKLENFKNQVTKLLPSLFLLASPDETSRSLSYRTPQISNEKYSAINTAGNSSIEYRVFETCYDSPESVRDFVEVIANTLKFYHDPTKQIERAGTSFDFPDNNRYVSRFYNTPEKVAILKKQLKHIKPANKTIKEILNERNVPQVIELRKKNKAEKKSLIKHWHELIERYNRLKALPMTEMQKMEFKRYAEHNYYYGSMTEDERDDCARNISKPSTLEQYLKDNLDNDGVRILI